MDNLQRLSDEGRLRRQAAGPSEIEMLLKVVDRDIGDAGVAATTADRRFATAYNAALQLATTALRAEGYRTNGSGHHRTTFAALPAILGADLQGTADFLDACRSRRNTVDYDGIGIATERDVAELLEEVDALRETVNAWLAEKHPKLVGRVKE